MAREPESADVTVMPLWGNAAALKARLREHDQREHLARPIDERLRAALAMVLPVQPVADGR